MHLAIVRRLAAALVVISAVALVTATPASAALLPPGGVVVPNATPSPTGATLLATTGNVAFASLVDPSAYSGSLNTSVYRNDPNNGFGLNALTFVYQLTNNATSRDAIERFVANNFATFQVDAANNATSGTRAPSTVDRQANGVSIGFDYTNTLPISPGTQSTLLVLHTNATLFAPTVNSISNTFPATVASLGPVVPEPTTLGAAALFGLALVRRRSR
jgi:hypothetical protein